MGNSVTLSLLDKVWLTVEEACAIAAVGKTTLYAAIGAGKLIAHKRGRRTAIHRQDLDTWLDAMPSSDGRKSVGEKNETHRKCIFSGDLSKE